ncbi:UNVERIFIED_CONTAM: hypothetical protein FKN15_038216 [Acipenser sinensis]
MLLSEVRSPKSYSPDTLLSSKDAASQSTLKVTQWPPVAVVSLRQSVEMNCNQSADNTYMYWYRQQNSNAASQSTLKVTQWPQVAVVSLRQSVEMNCNQSAANNYMYWYRQQNSSELQLVFYSSYGSDPEKDAASQSTLKVTQWPPVAVVSLRQSVEMKCNQSASNTYMYWYRQQHSSELQLVFSSPYGSDPEKDAASQSTLKVIQWPPVAVVSLRHSVEMNCNQSAANTYMYWYRQQNSSELQLVFYSPYGGDSEKDAVSQSTLKVTQWPPVAVVSLRQSVEMNCNQSASNTYMYWYRQQHSSELQLVFYSPYGSDPEKEKDPLPPKLHILEPSKEEIVQKKRVTLVCLATDFYPDHIEITWKINGKNRENGVKTDDYATKNNDKYSISSRLRLTPREWFNPKNTFTCDVKFYNETDKAISIVEYIKAKDEKDPVPPKLHILEPSKEEIVQKKRVTLVCLATDFYPDHIEITWKINGKNREDGVKTDDYAIKDNNANNYSISSRLRLTPREWFNPKNTFTCAVKFYNETDVPILFEEKIHGVEGRLHAQGLGSSPIDLPPHGV